MNMKVLVETLIEIPDMELLQQLRESIQRNRELILPNTKLFYQMLQTLFSCNSKNIKIAALDLYRFTFTFLLRTEIELSWNTASIGLMRMLGEEDIQMRKKSKDMLIEVIDATNNANIVLDKLYYEGLENESVLVITSSMKAILQILETYNRILDNKTSIRVVKLIMEKIISFAMGSKHIQIQKNAKEFLDKLFYMKIQKLDNVLSLMNEKVLEYLENLWMKNKEKLLQKQIDKQKDINPMEIKYEHLPLIRGKFFSVFQPFVFKNLFNPETNSAKLFSISQFKTGFDTHFQQLKKYLNVIFKVLLKFLPQMYYDLLMMLKKIVFTSGIINIVNLSVLPSLIIGQLSSENVPYRRELRNIFKKLNFEVTKRCLSVYQQQITKNNLTWIQMFEVICLVQHWIDNNMQSSYPPTLNKIVHGLSLNIYSQQTKVKDKSLQVLLMILDRYAGYRQNLEDYFSIEKISELEDALEEKKNKGRGNSMLQEAQQIFMRQYQQERQRFINHSKNLGQ